MRNLLELLSRRRDLALVALLMTTLSVMIIPLPPALLDVLIAFNIMLTMLILIVSVYLDQPSSFSTFPSVILIATTFRLAISVSATRSILINADGGEIIQTFGNYVTGGNIAVGLVIFLIITIVQFIVITKGAERVAEVSARFTLDALPGRQMSIDAELRAGNIEPGEAHRRRRILDKENQFFGAMDGAMKFVKGDAIAGLLIIAVNLLGGITVGVMQHGMTLGQAGQTYSLLTIGDGLVAQLPALLVAMCAGVVITRVTNDQKQDLGSDISLELFTNPRVMYVAGAIVAAMSLIPGFPWLTFLILGAILMGFGYLMAAKRKIEAARPAEEAAPEQETIVSSQKTDRILIHIGKDINARLDSARFIAARSDTAQRGARRYGMKYPHYGLMLDSTLGNYDVTVELDKAIIFNGTLDPDKLLVRTEKALLDTAGIVAESAGPIWPDEEAYFVHKAAQSQIENAGLRYLTIEELLAALADMTILKYIGTFVGFDTIQTMLAESKAENPELGDQVLQSVQRPKMVEIFRRLASEQVPLAPVRRIFESLAEASQKESDPNVLVEYVRGWLRHQICTNFADSNRIISGYVIEPDLEHTLRAMLKQTENGAFLMLSPAISNTLLTQLQSIKRPTDPLAPQPVILTSVDLRRHVRAYLLTHHFTAPVLSFQEIAPEFRFQPVGTLSLRHEEAQAA